MYMLCSVLAILMATNLSKVTATQAVFGRNLVDSIKIFKRISSGCGTSGQTSCLNTTVQTNTCCFEMPGVSVSFTFSLNRVSECRVVQGLLLQTQVSH